jgi:hypothetical protein
MKVMFGLLWKSLRKLWRSSINQTTGIDSHKWESKIEILRSLRRY